ncbi:hypothetical protein [Butyrivibrio sp. MC2013]|nr:hypothetical protein [Butyrivibrio sp. MC2013]
MPHKPLQTYDRKMKRFVTASESKAVTAEGISNKIGIRNRNFKGKKISQ